MAKETYQSMARRIFPEVPNTPRGKDFLGYLLWNETAYPFAGAEYVRQQLQEIRDSIIDVKVAYRGWLKGWHETQKFNRFSVEERRKYLDAQKAQP